ncbi:MAG TPA: MgtC/SapB family protein [Bryobacteraceae bacterium]|nr:MgtC/SapB family protein [Bryobacteraceae bacterium]
MTWQEQALLALRVVLAGVLGGIVGWQREHEGREAGVRTFAAVSLGACVFGLISQTYQGDTRIAAQVVSGIGFLGAGVIMRDQAHIHGLTTAAALWAMASVGLAVSYNRLVLGVLVAIILYVLLAIPLKRWERQRGTGNGPQESDGIHT